MLTDDEKLQNINNMLQGTGVKVDESCKADVIKKYDALSEYYSVEGRCNGENKDDVVKRRITNYIKGLEYRALDDKWAKAALDGETENAEKKTMPTTKAAYKELGAQYIETGDNITPDGVLDLEEYIALEAKSDGINPDELSEEQREAIKNTFNKLNVNNDDFLDSTELGTHFAIMSVINDKGNNGTFNDITAEEWATTQQALFDIPLEEMNLSDDSISKLENLLQNSTGKPSKEELISAGISEDDADKIIVYLASEHYKELSGKYYNLFQS